jgi:hypothetical protein
MKGDVEGARKTISHTLRLLELANLIAVNNKVSLDSPSSLFLSFFLRIGLNVFFRTGVLFYESKTRRLKALPAIADHEQGCRLHVRPAAPHGDEGRRQHKLGGPLGEDSTYFSRAPRALRTGV